MGGFVGFLDIRARLRRWNVQWKGVSGPVRERHD